MRICSSAMLGVTMVLAASFAAACEGDCIVGTTTAFVAKYQPHVRTALSNVAVEFYSRCFPKQSTPGKIPPSFLFLEPIWEAYDSLATARMEKAIFPSYFHGKCQRKDPHNPEGLLVNPPGCPKPDCPVICGTPGSMIHFYTTLRDIAFNSTRSTLREVAGPGAPAYKQALKKFKALIAKREVSRRADATRDLVKHKALLENKCHFLDLHNLISKALYSACGGIGLPACSWEAEMKRYIDTFP